MVLAKLESPALIADIMLVVGQAVLTVTEDGTIIPVIPINFFYVAVRHDDRWLIQDGRAHFALAPANSMTFRN